MVNMLHLRARICTEYRLVTSSVHR